MSSPRSSDEAFVREALRVYRRYVVELVEAFDLCPWAAPARREGHVTERVILAEIPGDPRKSLEQIAALASTPQIEVALFIYPDLSLDRLSFERFVRTLRERDAERHEPGEIPFALAAFHPDAPIELADAERLIPYLRRTPDPTIQLVRMSVLDRVRGKHPEGTAFIDVEAVFSPSMLAPSRPSLRQKIAQDNLETLLKVGSATLDAVVTDIRRDRDESYARLRSDPAPVSRPL
ncbi:MAG TPA: DUF1415 family protein [Polyangiaceae bacterium]|jgi:hypothetical protein